MKWIIAGLVALSAGGCAGEPKPAVRLVEVPAPVACTPKVTLTTGYPDTPSAVRAAADIFERTRLLLAGRVLRDADLALLKTALRGCGAEIGEGP